ncbi:MAG: altronate dehydratase family protein [Bryobacteraceae bacterium]|nr:altronate dehydratase family protein [Bryobacteraceae bacterium]MDW8378427.1 altronate dehydratase family protein [Bryobacterales bacterium]
MSFVEILPPPTAQNAVIHLHPSDNVAIARASLSPGQPLVIAGRQITVCDPVAVGHKVAIQAIPAGGRLIRYGQDIGRARIPIEPGQWVHTHNVGFEELHFNYEFPEAEIPVPQPPASVPTFLGFPREDGRAGTRNYIAVVAASNCAAHTAELIAASYAHETLPPNVDGVVAFPHGEGCGHSIGPDTVQLQRTLAGILHHPNVAAAIILGLGCEVNQIDHYLGASGSETPRSRRLVGLTLQSSGGTRATVEAARKAIAPLLEAAASEKRVELPASKIILGLNCGGSDSFSGITANPALGVCSDLLAGIGGTAVLAETPEIFGAEHLLVKRARNRAVAERLLAFVQSYKDYLVRLGGSFNDNPSPGNKEGGLTNILEKSLGAVAKAGSTPLMDAVDYAEPIRSPGFVFMNTPGYDPVSLTGLAAGGCNLIAFTTGRGSAIGFPTVPVIKIASNSATAARMRDNIDINAGRIADGKATVAELGKEIFDMVLRVASGERTCAELLGHKEFVPWRIGPVM